MQRHAEEWRAHRHVRFMRADARRYARPDGRRFVRPDAQRWRRGSEPYFDAWVPFDVLTGKANFNPNQPRVPAGNPDGGQWTSDGRSTGDGSRRVGDPASASEENKPSVPRAPLQITIRPPGFGHNGGPPLELPPDIPREQPRNRQLENRIARAAAQWLLRATLRGAMGPAGHVLAAIEVAVWLHEHLPNMQSYFELPKSLDDLRDAVATPKKGYDVHHIVEQGPAVNDGFPRALIDAPENLVRIPRYRHWQINSWFETENDAYGGLTPRQYLRGKNWQERIRVGLEALIKTGVLKP